MRRLDLILCEVMLCIIMVIFSEGLVEHQCIHDKMMTGAVVRKSDSVITVKRNAATAQSMRILIDTSYLDAAVDTERLCLNVGDWKKLNSPTTNSPTDPGAKICDTKCPCSSCTCTDCWFQCTSADLLTQQKRDFLETSIVPDTKNFFQQALNVDRLAMLTLSSQVTNCGCTGDAGADVPPSYITPGVQADMVLFLTARTTRYTGNTIAFACPCEYDGGTGRPIAGHINWGPNTIDTDPLNYKQQLGVGIHESTHALGFTYSLIQSLTQSGNLTSAGFPNHPITYVASKKVLENARAYFKCSNLVGLELENGGQQGTAASHWERRLVYNEYMTGYSSYDPVKSIFTLSLLEDLGWYYPNYSAADPLYWGAGQGCSFVQQRCNARPAPYYVGEDQEACTWDNFKKGRSNVHEYNGVLDSWYQYYADPKKGGNDDLADYCGFITYQSKYRGDCTVSAYNDPGDDYFNIENFGEHFCTTCRCITSQDFSGATGPSCHNFTCVNGALKMKIGFRWYDCSSNGFQISVPVEGVKNDYMYVCPSDVAAACADSPIDDNPWPIFSSISPTKGSVNDQITVTGLNFGNNPTILLGNYFGCITETITLDGNKITCKIGARDLAPIIRENTVVDVIIMDNQGRTGSGNKAFTLSIGTKVLAPSFLLLSFMILFVYSM